MTTPTQRTLALLRSSGYTVAITERWNAFSKTRLNLFGFINLIGIREGEIVGVQATSGPNVSARIEKIRGLPAHKEWLLAGGRILVIGWRKTGARGKRKLWSPRMVELTMDAAEEVSS